MADDVTFYFDPICPFTWRTSRWLREVTSRRGHNIGWQLMSLKMLNEGRELPEAFRDRIAFSIRPVRVLSATLDRRGADARRPGIGQPHHGDRRPAGLLRTRRRARADRRGGGEALRRGTPGLGR